MKTGDAPPPDVADGAFPGLALAPEMAPHRRSPRWLNQQQILPLVQFLALPLYWQIGRKLLGLEPAAALVCALLAPVAIHTLVLGLGFVVAYWNQHRQRGFRHSRRRDWLIAYLREAAVSIRQFYWLMPFRKGFRPPDPTPPPQAKPIILIHGYGCNRGLWLPAAQWFSRRGYQVNAINLQPLHCPIDDYARTIAAEVARVKAACGAPQVALVAHSMGGLAARAYLRYCTQRGQDPGVASLITLGTPHRGTHIAAIGLGQNAREMRYDADWLKDLEAFEVAHATESGSLARATQITTLNSLQDNIVSRPLEQRLSSPGARAIMVRRQGHMSLATSVRVFRLIDRILRRRTVPHH
jgi:triacylglycerol lipase